VASEKASLWECLAPVVTVSDQEARYVFERDVFDAKSGALLRRERQEIVAETGQYTVSQTYEVLPGATDPLSMRHQ
jgi:hypothetical protein